MDPCTTIRISIIGTGLIGPRHARSVVSHPEAELICLVDPRREAETVAHQFGVPIFRSVEHMLGENVKPDAAIVCTPNHSHVVVATELLQAGIHVLVEKPLSTTVESGRELLAIAAASGRHLLAGHHRRFNPYVTAAKRALSEGHIGKPIALSGLWMTYKPPSYFESPTEWRARPGSGGPILINLVHEVDTLQYLLGPITRVHAERTVSQRRHDVEEGAAILLRFASGVVGTFILSDACPSGHNFESGTGENPTIPQAGKDFYRIFGSSGTLSVGDMCLSGYKDEKTWTANLCDKNLPVGIEVPFDEQINNLVRVVQGLEGPRCAGDDGLSALMACDAVQRALETGLPIDIDHLRVAETSLA